MLKYKNTYKVIKQKDSKGNYSKNRDDNYIFCKKNVHIYRFNSDTLVVQFKSNKYANNKIKELSGMEVELKPFQRGDDEQTYLFKESNLDKVAEVVKAKKRIKREYTDEQIQVIKERLQKSLQK